MLTVMVFGRPRVDDRGLLGDAQGGVAVEQHQVDRAVGKLRTYFARGLLGKLQRRLPKGRRQRPYEVIEGFLHRDIAAGEWPLGGERRLYGVDHRLHLHDGFSPSGDRRAASDRGGGGSAGSAGACVRRATRRSARGSSRDTWRRR
mgnify:CR=1 FL=1